MSGPDGITFGSDNNLYVTNSSTNSVAAFQGTAGAVPGAFIKNFVTPNSAGMSNPKGLAFGPDGNLYVAAGNAIYSFFGLNAVAPNTPGAPIPSGRGNGVYANQSLNGAYAVTFGSGGYLFATSSATNQALQYGGPAANAGNLIGNFAAILDPTGLALDTGRVIAVNINNGGMGYTSPPMVTFSGGGATTQATGTAVVVNGVVTAITITSPGIGYTSAPTINFTGGTPATPASATAVISGAITGATLTNFGEGYTSAPMVTFNGGNPTTPATGTAVITTGVSSIAIANGGVGYTSAPTVVFTDPGTPPTTQATATAVVVNGVVTAIKITNPGSGYTSAPTISFTGGGTPTTPATATANISGVVSAINITNPGAGYTSAPTITLAGGGFTTQATATPVLSGNGDLFVSIGSAGETGITAKGNGRRVHPHRPGGEGRRDLRGDGR